MNILERILGDTRRHLQERRQKVAPGALLAQVQQRGPARSLARALATEQLSIIAEVKRASPSKGPLRIDADAAAIAEAYEKAGASAVSILTEQHHFRGSIHDLAAARERTALPLLRKDFIVDPYQLLEARAYGADAVLLIATALESAQLAELQAAAAELGLECLVEVYALEELDKLDFGLTTILGVNNRDLQSFSVDINHSLRVFAHVPGGILRVSESGLRSAAELAHLHRSGVDAVLMGETFMVARDCGGALRRLRGQLAHSLAA